MVKVLGGHRSTDHKGQENATVHLPGEIIGVTKDALHIACGQDILAVTQLQLEGKKRMDTGAFLRGYQIEPGTMLEG